MLDVAQLCWDKFNQLPKTGKPTANEWTVVAAVIQRGPSSSKVIAIGSGTKCLGESKLSGTGFLLNDSHAEVLARRAFLRYIYHELQQTGGKSIFTWNAEQSTYSLADGISFHFFSTHTPCGDACIVEELEGDVEGKRRKIEQLKEDDHGEVLHPPLREEGTVYTGAKLIGEPAHADVMRQTTGAVRTKPGRGDRTLSVSCSDKLARWNVLGVQGALLATLLARPIYFESLTFGCRSTKNKAALERAIYGRWWDKRLEHTKFKPQRPEIRICSVEAMRCFQFAQTDDKLPAAAAVVWSDLPADAKPYEISVNGLRQGVTKRRLDTPQAALRISKYWLRLEYLEAVRSQPLLPLNSMPNLDNLTYAALKQLSVEYQETWTALKREYFGQWTKKSPALLQFTSRRFTRELPAVAKAIENETNESNGL